MSPARCRGTPVRPPLVTLSPNRSSSSSVHFPYVILIEILWCKKGKVRCKKLNGRKKKYDRLGRRVREIDKIVPRGGKITLERENNIPTCVGMARCGWRGKARGKSLLSRHLNPNASFASPPRLRSSRDINGLTVVPDCPKYTDRAANVEF